jgi:S1-C subfamily serine protease
MELVNEKYITRSPNPVTIEGTTKILEQLKHFICKIYKGNGTGFFCKINHKNKANTVLITNYHVIDDKYKKKIKF